MKRPIANTRRPCAFIAQGRCCNDWYFLMETITLVWILDTHIEHHPRSIRLGFRRQNIFMGLFTLCQIMSALPFIISTVFLEMRNNKNKSDAEMRTKANHRRRRNGERKCRNNAEHKWTEQMYSENVALNAYGGEGDVIRRAKMLNAVNACGISVRRRHGTGCPIRHSTPFCCFLLVAIKVARITVDWQTLGDDLIICCALWMNDNFTVTLVRSSYLSFRQ